MRNKGQDARTKKSDLKGSSLLASFRSSSGFSYIALLAAITIIGISLGAVGKYWHNVLQRDKEEELLFRGDQIRRAIGTYFRYGNRNQYPASLDNLLKDERSPTGIRHLRQKYKDPITGEDFVETRDPLTRGIMGVYSSSSKKPLKQANFPPDLAFTGMSKYSDWKFNAFLPASP